MPPKKERPAFDELERKRIENIKKLRLRHEQQLMAAAKPAMSAREASRKLEAAASGQRQFRERDAAKAEQAAADKVLREETTAQAVERSKEQKRQMREEHKQRNEELAGNWESGQEEREEAGKTRASADRAAREAAEAATREEAEKHRGAMEEHRQKNAEFAIRGRERRAQLAADGSPKSRAILVAEEQEKEKAAEAKRQRATARKQAQKVMTKKTDVDNGKEGAAGASVVDRLSNPKGFTGLHKQRFDQKTGKGRGLLGRRDSQANIHDLAALTRAATAQPDLANTSSVRRAPKRRSAPKVGTTRTERLRNEAATKARVAAERNSSGTVATRKRGTGRVKKAQSSPAASRAVGELEVVGESEHEMQTSMSSSDDDEGGEVGAEVGGGGGRRCEGDHAGENAVDADAGIFDRLTNPRLFTGAHRSRFDDDGKGRGVLGRRDSERAVHDLGDLLRPNVSRAGPAIRKAGSYELRAMNRPRSGPKPVPDRRANQPVRHCLCPVCSAAFVSKAAFPCGLPGGRRACVHDEDEPLVEDRRGGGAWSGTPIRDTSCFCHLLNGVPYLRPGPRRLWNASGKSMSARQRKRGSGTGARVDLPSRGRKTV